MDKKKLTGRPPKDKYNVDTLINGIEKYMTDTLKDNKLPILKEFTTQNRLHYEYVLKKARENESLLQSIKWLTDTKEVKLERGMLDGTFDRGGAIFSLKQLGWTDNNKNNDTSDILKPLNDYFSQLKADAKKDTNEDD